MTIYETIESPVGDLLLTGDGEAITGVHIQGGRAPVEPQADWRRRPRGFSAARRQLREYFAGRRTEFELDLAAPGTAFQRRVWGELARIPYGETITYAELAQRVGKPGAHRAVGAANGANPISIVVPCHRVVGSDGSLTGYGGGVERKRYLLELESRVSRA